MTLEEMLRGSPLNQQRMAEDNAMNLAGMLARGRAGTGRQEPSLMQKIGGAITDYAVPDRYLPSSVMEPRLDMSQLEALRGTPINMADVPDPVPMLMDVMPQAGIAGTFAGIGSRTANKLALQKAKDLAGQGVNRKQIWDETGWFNDVDGKWKYEIDDSGMEVRDFRPTGGGISIKHDELYKAYPESINTKVVPTQNVGEGEGAFHPTYDYGSMTGHKGAILVNDKNIPPKDVFAHELQHMWPQTQEGFARGGNPHSVGLFSADRTGSALIANTARKIQKWSASYPDALDKLKGRVPKDVWDEAVEWAGTKTEQQLNALDIDPQFEAYKRLAGEAEARNVQTRMDFTPEQRQAQPPWETLDVPEEELLVRMLQEGPSLATAWHGSPHKFSKFDMSKIGTGEGAQAYGHGLYMAENPAVARGYKEALTSTYPGIDRGFSKYQIKDIPFPQGRSGHQALDTGQDIEMLLGHIQRNESPDMQNYLREKIESRIKYYKESRAGGGGSAYDDMDELIKFYESHVQKVNPKDIGENFGYTYKVDIPDDQIAKMLDWDKPLSEQSSVMDFIEKNYRKANKPFEDSYVSPDNRLFHPEDSTAFEFLQSFGSGNRAKASEMLKDHGIPGIKYLDQGSRQGGKGTSNFVLFADDIAKILERNDQPIGDLAEGLLGKPLTGERLGKLMSRVKTRKEKPLKQELINKYGTYSQSGLMRSGDKPGELASLLAEKFSLGKNRRKLQKRLGDPLHGKKPGEVGRLARKKKSDLWKKSAPQREAKLALERSQNAEKLEMSGLWNKGFSDRVKKAASNDAIFGGYKKAFNEANMEAVPRIMKKEGWTVRHASKGKSGKKSSRYLLSPDGKFEVRLSDHYLPDTPQREYSQGKYGMSWDDEIVLHGNESPLEILDEIKGLYMDSK